MILQQACPSLHHQRRSCTLSFSLWVGMARFCLTTGSHHHIHWEVDIVVLRFFQHPLLLGTKYGYRLRVEYSSGLVAPLSWAEHISDLVQGPSVRHSCYIFSNWVPEIFFALPWSWYMAFSVHMQQRESTQRQPLQGHQWPP